MAHRYAAGGAERGDLLLSWSIDAQRKAAVTRAFSVEVRLESTRLRQQSAACRAYGAALWTPQRPMYTPLAGPTAVRAGK